MSFNLKAINTAVITALKAGDALNAECLALQALFKGADRDTIKGIVCPMVAKHYGEGFADGKWADKDCAAKRKANRLIAAIVGTAPAKQSRKVAVNKALVAAMAKLAIDAGLTKAEFTATLAAVKAAVSFA